MIAGIRSLEDIPGRLGSVGEAGASWVRGELQVEAQLHAYDVSDMGGGEERWVQYNWNQHGEPQCSGRWGFGKQDERRGLVERVGG